MKKNLSIVLSTGLVFTGLTYIQLTHSHGSFEEPLSRVYGCRLEGPENPLSDACRDAVAIGGTQPLYDWAEVNQPFANGDHRPLIPDGTLCAGGRDKYRGLNQGRDDWVTYPIPYNAAGGIDFVYNAHAPHISEYFRFYITKDNYDHNTPLRWEDLEDDVFCEFGDVPLDSDQKYRMTCPAPANKVGRHIIYNIWQRDFNLSQEAFYACIDVDFGNSSDLIFMNGFE